MGGPMPEACAGRLRLRRQLLWRPSTVQQLAALVVAVAHSLAALVVAVAL